MVAAALFPDLDGHWLPVTDADARLYALYRRHYSYEKTRNYPGKVRLRQNGRICKMQGFGDYMALITADCQAGWIWSRPPDGISQSGQRGVNCVLFRNEGPLLSSDLIREASDLAWQRWPEDRLYTYVWDTKVATAQQRGRATAGWCYRKAGWRPCGRNDDGRLTILEIFPPSTPLERHRLDRAAGNLTPTEDAQRGRHATVLAGRPGGCEGGRAATSTDAQQEAHVSGY